MPGGLARRLWRVHGRPALHARRSVSAAEDRCGLHPLAGVAVDRSGQADGDVHQRVRQQPQPHRRAAGAGECDPRQREAPRRLGGQRIGRGRAVCRAPGRHGRAVGPGAGRGVDPCERRGGAAGALCVDVPSRAHRIDDIGVGRRRAASGPRVVSGRAVLWVGQGAGPAVCRLSGSCLLSVSAAVALAPAGILLTLFLLQGTRSSSCGRRCCRCSPA